MILQPKQSISGFTLFEALIALSILSLVTAAIVILRPAPSSALLLNQAASELIESAAAHRQRAVVEGEAAAWKQNVLTCEGQPFEAKFYPDGSADPGEICVTVEQQMLKMILHPISGRLEIIDQ